MQPNAVWRHALLGAQHMRSLALVRAAEGQQELVLAHEQEASCLYHSWEVSSLPAGSAGSVCMCQLMCLL